MEIRRRIDFRKVFVCLYVLAFSVYLINGLRPADAITYEIETELNIPSINLVSDVTRLKLEDYELKTPDTIVGSFSYDDSKILLIGHSSTVFHSLHEIAIDDEIVYDDTIYTVENMVTYAKEEIDMDDVLSPTNKKTLVIMTCAGQNLDGGDATHRLIVTAVAK